MSAEVPLILGRPLLPDLADWSQRPGLDRSWASEVASALSGQEDRSFCRGTPWVRQRYSVLLLDQVARARFERRLAKALLLAKAAAPLWGTGAGVAEQVDEGALSMRLARDSHGLQAMDYVLVADTRPGAFDWWEVLPVSGASGCTLELAAPTARSYSPGACRAWRLGFGRVLEAKSSMMNASASRFELVFLADWRPSVLASFEDFSDYASGPFPAGMFGGESWGSTWSPGYPYV